MAQGKPKKHEKTVSVSKQPPRKETCNATSTYGKTRVVICDDATALGRAAAASVAAVIRRLARKQRNIKIVFAAAESQVPFLDALASEPRLPWKRIICFNMDELWAPDLPASSTCADITRRHLYEKVGVKVWHAPNHRAPDAEAEARRFEKLLRRHAPLDIVCQGIGRSGHIALNEPGQTDFADPRWVRVVKINEISRRQLAEDPNFRSAGAIPSMGITMTLPALMSARHIFTIVPMASKRAVLKRLLKTTRPNPQLPASIISVKSGTMFVDRASWPGTMPPRTKKTLPKPPPAMNSSTRAGLAAPKKSDPPPVITLIGAGSQVFGFSMGTDICQSPALRRAEIRLMDINAQRLEIMAQLFRRLNELTGMELNIKSFTELDAALPGSRFIIVSVASERIKRWETDLRISAKYGIVETQGECGGPGGLSLTLRNVPIVLEIARHIEGLAPQALVINFTNPMTRICMALRRYTKLNAIGLCHGMVQVQNHISRVLNRPVLVRGCGINHFNWITDIRWADTGENAWREATDAFCRDASPDFAFVRDLFSVFGRIVTPDDGHICDFLHHWRGNANGLNPAYNLHPKNMDAYRDSAAHWENRMRAYLSGKLNPMDDVSGLSGEGAIPIILATAGLAPAYEEIAVNIPNRGYIENLPHGAVVEVPARISRQGIVGVKMGPLPAALKGLIARQLDIAELAVEAAVECNREKALQALALDPIVPDLATARAYLAEILAAHSDALPAAWRDGASK